MSLSLRDPRRRKPPFDVPSERKSTVDVLTAAVVGLVVVLVAAILWFTGSAASAGLDEAAGDQPAYGPSTTVPAKLSPVFRTPSTGTGAPLVTRGTLVTSEEGRVVAREAGSGNQMWAYEHPGSLCDAAFYAERVVTVWNGADGCSDVTMVDATKGTYAATRQSAFPARMTLVTDKDHVLAFSPERLEIWRNDLVRTIEYGQVLAPQESGQQPRSGCTMRSAALSADRFAVAERCPGDETDRLTLSKSVPKDSRKPEETGSDTTGAERLDVLAVLRDGVLAVQQKKGAWTVEMFSAPGKSTKVASLPGAPTSPVGPATVNRGGGSVRWFDGTRTHSFDTNTGEEKWAAPATGPGIEWGHGTGADPVQPHPFVLMPTAEGIAMVDTAAGRVQRQYPLRLLPGSEATGGVVGLAQIGDILFVRQPGEILAYKAA